MAFILTNASDTGAKVITEPILWQDFIVSPSLPASSSAAVPIEMLLQKEITLNERQKYCDQTLPTIPNGTAPTCWNGMFISSWRTNVVSKGFCDKDGKSHITCYDTTTLGQPSRACTFENAMLDFSKMRTKERSPTGQGSKNKKGNSRMFQRGFLSLDCDVPEYEDQSTEGIGYFAVYNPNVQNADEATCDRYYNGTMVMYSVSVCLFVDFSHLFLVIYLTMHLYVYGINH